jgi:hypothetical protein
VLKGFYSLADKHLKILRYVLIPSHQQGMRNSFGEADDINDSSEGCKYYDKNDATITAVFSGRLTAASLIRRWLSNFAPPHRHRSRRQNCVMSVAMNKTSRGIKEEKRTQQ